jgi:hypothetical protein
VNRKRTPRASALNRRKHSPDIGGGYPTYICVMYARTS